jgi:phosphoglucomutase
MTAQTEKDPGELFKALTDELGASFYERIDAPATPAQKDRLKKLSAEQLGGGLLAGETIRTAQTSAPGNDQPIGGIKVVSDGGWFAARPSGTEDVYKIYAESFQDAAHLQRIQQEAQAMITRALS